ncbi:MAG: alanine--glyoxylate aminotransferase family protein [Candidatus Marinimicrobia bacterium]|jgi:aspartate aminotransferase-like enzyme|nr:aminotransferase [Candidatus Neomarinimicrobiota bacterium]MDP6457582.1 alanine--glyoxylate aminotransferase family protein [Candidatus Neomarinimicrobiota bacterium]MDP6594068.1 alanine--glyoxylate aminotransferase family protein [Candidatus Neomarinimicrobiota bacterium]MDP6836947.1 alanine--glyoxylate aminotransferase family protein [Candidatus Neomarinimicrobiota bacterium]MDP6966611.1 alanine--glyoxylate aminotransferase family protein [Candidatus Neomarinimicrobiota bacterium]|tara:strand:+ start:1851 stop:2936 length:1086 start_codon:yes stop_codon:yes gene_type:complete
MSSHSKPKLFIPGPTHVEQEVLTAMSEYPVGHRSATFSELYDDVISGVARILYTDNRIYLGTCTATGFMEAAVRNTVQKRCANFICGAFSKRWHQITKMCGILCDPFEVEMGMANKPEAVEAALSTGRYDAVTVVHSETSTGVLNPLDEIAAVVNQFPDVVLLIDMVTSMAGIKTKVDKLGIDVALAGVQKGWGIPPGIAFCSVSDRALAKSEQTDNKGFYFDFQVMEKYAKRSQTPTTPSISHMYAMQTQLNRIFDEGLDQRFERHSKMAERVRKWAREEFSLFAEEGYESDTVTCVQNSRGVDLTDLLARLLKKGYMISGGYGPLKGKTFRIAHMGDLQLRDIEEILSVLDETLLEMNV